ncbi:MAG: glycoside hydrolase family 95 protein [Acidobacteriia bacterium]|nr:glycoside hydrolase family 95 protein [Terriglobia bacterium]
MNSTDTRHSRRAFLATGLAASTAVAKPASPAEEENPASPSSLSDVNFRQLISRADLIYDKPVPRSEEGIPIGNGRMGSLVWTTPTQLRFQINRVDVYANNSATNSFFERHNDYCGGCGYVDIDFAGSGDDPFPEAGFAQHLSVYDGALTIDARNLAARVLAWPAEDVMMVAVDDRRPSPAPVSVTLRMLRYETKYFGQQLETFVRDHVVTVQNRNHTAASQLTIRGGRIALTQEFREGDFCCKSAVAIALAGRQAKPRFLNETAVAITAAPSTGPFSIRIASAASFDPQEDVLAAAFRQLDAAEARGPAALAQESQEWWHAFWPRAFVHLHSQDGVADFVEQNYHYFLYVMASSSRGKLPPKFNGMIWNTGGDLRTWGAQHWFANLSCYYEAIPASNRFELMDPMFDMYSGMYNACSVAARQQWGSEGMYIPETTYFDGLERLPEEIASEMRDLYLLRKPWEQRSPRFMEFAQTKHPHSSRWNWIQNAAWEKGRLKITERGSGPYGAVTHIFGSTAKIAYLYWRRYEFTLDREWLRSRAYPMLRAAAEFYRHHPNLQKGADGKYHLHWANSNESIYGARDTDEDLSAMRGVVAAVLRASEILNSDAPMRPVWREFLDNLAPLPLSDDPEALRPADYSGPRVFARGRKPVVKSGGGILPDGNSLPMWFFDLCNVESRDRQTLDIANTTFTQFFRNGLTPQTPVSVLSKIPIAAASLGRAEAVRYLIPNQIRALAPERATAYRNGGVLANRMTLREGPQALDAQRLGRAAEGLHLALLQSNPPAPGEDPILHVFPAWPKEWDARYTLLGRGAFLVSSSMRNGRVEFVELESQQGAECRLRNPFEGDACLYRDGKKAETLQGSLLRFPTRRGEALVVVAVNTAPEDFRRAVPEG